MKIHFTLIIVVLSLFVSLQKVSAQNYDPDFFPLGVWSIKGDYRNADDFLFNEDTAAAYHHQTFSDLKAQGFNAAFLSYDPITYTLDTILDIAEVYDLKIIAPAQNLRQLIISNESGDVADADILNALDLDLIDLQKNSSATMGYYLYDEPLPGWIDFDLLERCKNILETATNTNPHPILSVWNDESQMDYISSFIDLEVVMFDTYPLEDGDALGDLSEYMPSYFVEVDPIPSFSEYADLVRANHCDADNKPMWAVIQTFGDLEVPENGGYWRQVYPKEIRMQVYQAVMQGAKGIWYFLYESEYPYLLGMLDVTGQPTARLYEVEEINEEIATLSETLLKLQVIPNYTDATTDIGQVRMHVDLSSENQDKYVIAINEDVANASYPTISVLKSSVGYEVESIINMYDNSSVSFSETATTYEITPTIETGSGVLLKLSDQLINIENLNLDKEISLYPNPTKAVLNIKHNNDLIDLEEVYIQNSLGQEVEHHYFTQGNKSQSINLSNLKNGVYLIEFVSNHNVVLTKMFIKQ